MSVNYNNQMQNPFHKSNAQVNLDQIAQYEEIKKGGQNLYSMLSEYMDVNEQRKNFRVFPNTIYEKGNTQRPIQDLDPENKEGSYVDKTYFIKSIQHKNRILPSPVLGTIILLFIIGWGILDSTTAFSSFEGFSSTINPWVVTVGVTVLIIGLSVSSLYFARQLRSTFGKVITKLIPIGLFALILFSLNTSTWKGILYPLVYSTIAHLILVFLDSSDLLFSSLNSLCVGKNQTPLIDDLKEGTTSPTDILKSIKVNYVGGETIQTLFPKVIYTNEYECTARIEDLSNLVYQAFASIYQKRVEYVSQFYGRINTELNINYLSSYPVESRSYHLTKRLPRLVLNPNFRGLLTDIISEIINNDEDLNLRDVGIFIRPDNQGLPMPDNTEKGEIEEKDLEDEPTIDPIVNDINNNQQNTDELEPPKEDSQDDENNPEDTDPDDDLPPFTV